MEQTLCVGVGMLERAGRLLAERGLVGRAFVVSDERVFARHGDALVASLKAAGFEPAATTVEPVETSKSLATATRLYGWLAEHRAERRDFVIALGGGLVGDLAGFVAATYLRGLPIVQIPTTLLAQVDSAIGGKTGVNLEGGKNLVGAWHVPHTIVVDPATLLTLPAREIASGWCETIKHALLMDADLLRVLEENVDRLLALDLDLTADVVRRSGMLKVGVVEEDPREHGRRIILNYGHTIGHAIEAATAYKRYLHGEAIAIGLGAAGRIGRALGTTPAELEQRQRALLSRFGLPLVADGVAVDRVRAAISLDKKVEDRAVRWVLLEDVERPVVRRDVPTDVVEAALAEALG